MQKPFILILVGGFLTLCIGAQMFSVTRPNSMNNVVRYYYMH
jgi:hypothetical protein